MTTIEWTNETWNPTTGCKKVSEGCANCYAESIANRFWGDRKFTDVQFHSERLVQPLKWRKPRMVFVNSMSDLFHEDISFDVIAAIFGVMAITPKHTFQVLTKRPYRMIDFFDWLRSQSVSDLWTECHFFALQRDNDAEDIHRFDYKGDPDWPLPNVWIGVTCENQRTADERIPLLLQTPAAVRFLSCEPLLERIDLPWGYEEKYFPGLNWVIVGGESGSKARICNIDWIESIVEQCKEAGVACFVKQLGSNAIAISDMGIFDLSNTRGKANNPDEWPENLRVRQFPTTVEGAA